MTGSSKSLFLAEACDGFVHRVLDLPVQFVPVDRLELNDSAGAEKSFEDVNEQVPFRQATAIDGGPDRRDGADERPAAADGSAAGEDLVERSLTEGVQQSIAIDPAWEGEQVGAPPQSPPDVACDVRAEHAIDRRSGIAPVGDVGQEDQGEEDPDVSDRGLPGD